MNEKQQKLSTQPYKGARDFYPEDMRVQNYIYDTWKKVCKRFGFEQYDFPILEPLELFASKTGEEIVNEQLFSFEDKGGRKLAIRPEITPSTVRMIAQKYKELPQPIKWFMIGSNWRYEKPQLGRGREFYQLEANIFGVNGVEADFEIFTLIIAIMKEFGAKENMYGIKVSDRGLLTSLLQDILRLDNTTQEKVRKLMDKRSKLEKDVFSLSLKDLGLDDAKIQKVEDFLSSTLETLKVPQDNPGLQTIQKLNQLLKQSSLDQFVTFDPGIIRGFDYSDGLVYEVYDKNPVNKRSIFGGERFDKLINVFGNFDLPSTGFAMGDYTLLEFLKAWSLLPKLEDSIDYFISLWPTADNKSLAINYEVADKLRSLGKNCFVWLENGTKLEKQLKYADIKKAQFVLIIGEEELKNKTITIKNMKTGAQENKPLEKFFAELE